MRRVNTRKFTAFEQRDFVVAFVHALPLREGLYPTEEGVRALEFAEPWDWAGAIPACGARTVEELARVWAAMVLGRLDWEARLRWARAA